jgi:cell division protein FtsA
MQSLLQHPNQILGLLDIGTAKVVCVLVLRETNGAVRVIGLGHQRSRGLKASVIIDADAAEDSVRAAVSQAEQMAGVRVEDVVMSAACGRLASNHLATGLDLGGRAVTTADIEKLRDAGRAHADQEDRAPLHLEVMGARLDGHPVAGAVIGRQGQRVALDIHLVSADRAPLRHHIHIAERCHLRVLAMAPAPLVSALAVTTPLERAQGAIVIDCGAGTTGLSLFSGGACVGVHVVQVGGNHLTYDVTRAFGLPLNEAERIKKNYAIECSAHAVPEQRSALNNADSARLAGDVHAPSKQVTRAAMITTLTTRVDALLQQILQRVQRTGIPADRLCHVVLTGGGALLPLLMERAGLALKRPTRLAAPYALNGWPHALLLPAFATVAGLQQVALNPALGLRLAVIPIQHGQSGHPGADVWRRQSM